MDTTRIGRRKHTNAAKNFQLFGYHALHLTSDLTPCDYYLFLLLFNFLVNKRSILKKRSKDQLYLFFASMGRNFHNLMSLLVKRWQKAVLSNGD